MQTSDTIEQGTVPCFMASAIISDILSAQIVKKYSATIALALLGCRKLTIVGLTINLGELLSGRNVIFRSRAWW